MRITPLLVSYDPTDRGLVAMLAWMDVVSVDSERGIRIAIVPTTLFFNDLGKLKLRTRQPCFDRRAPKGRRHGNVLASQPAHRR